MTPSRGPFRVATLAVPTMALVLCSFVACQGGARARAKAGQDGAKAGDLVDPTPADAAAAKDATAEVAPPREPKKPRPRVRDPLSVRGPDPVEEAPAAPVEPTDPATEDCPDGLPPTHRLVTGPSRPDDPDRRAPCKVAGDVDADLQEKFATAQSAMSASEDELALDIVSAVLAQEPKDPWGTRFRALRLEIRSRHLETDVVRVDVRGVREYVPFETDIDLIVRVRNVGTAELVIQPPLGQGSEATSGSALVLSIRRRDRDVYAAELTRSWTQTVPLRKDGSGALRIPPEGQHEVRVRVSAEEAGPTIAGIRVLEVGGDLRAGRISAGVGEPFGRIPIRTGRVVILPKNFEPLAADPLGSMKKALAARAPVHLLVACAFIPPSDRPAAIAVLADGLLLGSAELRATILNCLHLLRQAAEGAPLQPLATPMMAALDAHPEGARDLTEGLRALTGVSLAPDARLWQDWWRRERLGTPSVVEGDEDLGALRSSRPKR